jgi:outer membrane protein assembly factor BamB
VWCGSGWTGQPVVWERPDGVTEVIFGAYDKNIHFLDAATGERTRPDFDMGDIIKGSVTLDPDGHPLLYAGSRDPRFRIIALDRDTPTELWSLDATAVPGMWNNDWDSNPVVVDGVLYVGGENSWWFAIELNRAVDAEGRVTVAPEIVFDTPAFTDELVAAVGRQQSVENSTAVFEDRAYFATSAGRIVGVDIGALPDGEGTIAFDYWVGDDVDATIVTDDAGDLYVAAQIDHGTSRGREVGQLVKLDPDAANDPRVWGVDVPAEDGLEGGIWATPALVDDVLFVATNPGELLVVDTTTGEVVWRDDIGAHAWSSPVAAGDRLLVAVDCDTNAALRVYDISDLRAPVRVGQEAFSGGCIESTPALWNGRIYVGSRDGFFYALGQ